MMFAKCDVFRRFSPRPHLVTLLQEHYLPPRKQGLVRAKCLFVITAAILLTTLAILGVCVSGRAGSQHEKWLSYEPAVVELEGRLTIQTKYGPPGYGEDPKTDVKVRVPILLLPEEVNVRGDPENELNQESVNGVKQIQLVLPTGRSFSKFVGRRVHVRGTLFHSFTGHHYTPVLMIVHELKEAQQK